MSVNMNYLLKFGLFKGKTINSILNDEKEPLSILEWYSDVFKKDIDDKTKLQFKKENEEAYETLEMVIKNLKYNQIYSEIEENLTERRDILFKDKCFMNSDELVYLSLKYCKKEFNLIETEKDYKSLEIILNEIKLK